MDGWQRVGASNAPAWRSRMPSWSVSFTCSRVVNRITSWERATSTNGGGTILSIGWPNGLSDLVIGSTLNRWRRPPRKKFSRQPLWEPCGGFYQELFPDKPLLKAFIRKSLRL